MSVVDAQPTPPPPSTAATPNAPSSSAPVPHAPERGAAAIFPPIDPRLDRVQPPPPLRPRRRLRIGIELAVIAVLVAITLSFDRSPLIVIPVLFLLVVPFEKLFPRHRGQRLRRPALTTDLTYAVINPTLTVITVAVAVVVGAASLLWIPGLLLRPLVALLPPVVLPVVAVVLFDLAGYWVHRWAHEVPMLWRFHAVHHSTEHLDWVSGFRIHPLDGALVAPPFVFLVAAGFDPEVAGALAVIQIVVGIFLHANVRWRLRPLQRVVATPEFHHWHHTNDPRAIHSNYAGLLPIWDQLFGTYYVPGDRRPDRYGIDEYMPSGVLAQLRHPLRGVPNPLRAMRHPALAARAFARGVATLVTQVYRSTSRRRRGQAPPTVSSGGGADRTAPDRGADRTAPDRGADRTAPDRGADRTAPDRGADRTAPDR
ncbi:MAG: sterol desaturase family protein, partial [Actinomycetota bacterium]